MPLTHASSNVLPRLSVTGVPVISRFWSATCTAKKFPVPLVNVSVATDDAPVPAFLLLAWTNRMCRVGDIPTRTPTVPTEPVADTPVMPTVLLLLMPTVPAAPVADTPVSPTVTRLSLTVATVPTAPVAETPVSVTVLSPVASTFPVSPVASTPVMATVTSALVKPTRLRRRRPAGRASIA